MTGRLYVLGLCVAGLVAADARAQTRPPAARVIELSIVARTVKGPDVRSAGRTAGVVRVVQGERVELSWSSDERAILHLHGYNIEVAVEPNGPRSAMTFLARAAGRFPVETHGVGTDKGRHLTLLYVEVTPG